MVDADEEIEVIPHSIVIIPLEMLEDEIQVRHFSCIRTFFIFEFLLITIPP